MKDTYYEQLSFKELMLRCLEQIVTMYFAILGIGAIVVLILGEINIHQLEEKYPTSNLSGIEIRPIVREMNQNCIKYLLLFEMFYFLPPY